MIEQLTGWDWFVMLVMLASAGLGLARGLVRTVFALAAWVGGLLGAPFAGTWLMQQVGEAVPPWVVFVLAFLLVFVAIRLTGALAARALQGLGLGGLDRLLGGALGMARALLIVLLVVVGAHRAGMSEQPAWQKALSRPMLDAMVDWVSPLLPERLGNLRWT